VDLKIGDAKEIITKAIHLGIGSSKQLTDGICFTFSAVQSKQRTGMCIIKGCLLTVINFSFTFRQK